MFDLKNNSNEELETVVEGLRDAILNSPRTGDVGDEALRKLIAPFMTATIEEILRLRLELSNANEIKALQKELINRQKEVLNKQFGSVA